jgi:hypothetical protein
MLNLKLSAGIGVSNQKYLIGLSLIQFNEKDVIIIYSPALDLSGYGHSSEEAKNSFSESCTEFFRYTTNKKTLDKVLLGLGWKTKSTKNNIKYTPPKDSDLVSSNSMYNDIVNKKNYSVSREEIELAF